MYLKGSIEAYLDDAAAEKDAPGGGSVSALCGALGASMASMVANFTVGREKFAAVEKRVREILNKAEEARRKMSRFMDEDVEEYKKVTAAYQMPKGTDAEKAARKAAIQEALKSAMRVPLECVRTAHSLILDLKDLVEMGNPNLISDVGVSAILLSAALDGAKLNVEINLKFLTDTKLVENVRKEIEEKAFEAKSVAVEVVGKVREKIK
ncbi:MAG: cyclodeaminase/cyclohydrolase family protein [Planctomycetota bacterium]|nr:cyclodeaminase/cyclohydrolase family protein [Planctomycetota bacterium]